MTPQERTDAVLDFSADGMTFTSKDIAKSLHLTPLQARRAIHPLVESGKILAQGNTRARTYRIKRKRARYGALDATVTPANANLEAHGGLTLDYDYAQDIGERFWRRAVALSRTYPDEPSSWGTNRPSKWQRIVAFLKGE